MSCFVNKYRRPDATCTCIEFDLVLYSYFYFEFGKRVINAIIGAKRERQVKYLQ